MHALVILAVLSYAPKSGHGQNELGRVSEALKAAVRASGAQVIEHPIERAEHAREEGWEAPGASGPFADGARAIAEGRHALEEVELDAAQASFARAEQIYLAALGRSGAAALASDAALGEGIALFELGRQSEAAQAFRRARALDPAAELTQATVRPDIVRAFAAAVVPGPERARLEVRIAGRATGGAAGEVRIDGSAFGPAPITAEVAVGPHLVEARVAGRPRVARLIEVGAAGLAVELPVPDDPVRVALETLRGWPSGAGVRALAESLHPTPDGALAVAVGVDAGVVTLVGQRFDARGCASPPVTVAAAGGNDRAARELTTRIARLAVACGPGAPSADGRLVMEAPPIVSPRPAFTEPPTPKPRRVRFYERPWLWAGLLAITSVGVGLAAGLAQPSPSYRATVSGSAFSR